MPFRQRMRNLLRKLKDRKEASPAAAAVRARGTPPARPVSTAQSNGRNVESSDGEAVPPPISRTAGARRSMTERRSINKSRGPRESVDSSSARDRRSIEQRADQEPKYLYPPELVPEASEHAPSVVCMSAIGPQGESRPNTGDSVETTETNPHPPDIFVVPAAAAAAVGVLKRSSMRSDQELMLPPSRTWTENTATSSDYDNHCKHALSSQLQKTEQLEATTQSLPPPPSQSAGNNEENSSRPVSLRPEKETQSDGMDAFVKRPDLGMRRIPTFGGGAGSHESAGTEESVFIKRFTPGQKIAHTEVRRKHHKPIIHERAHLVEREEITEVITREHHHYHIMPKVQPIIDREYLPTKYYLQTEEGQLKEISSEEARFYGEPIWRGEQIIAADETVEEAMGLSDSRRGRGIKDRRDADGNPVDCVVDGIHNITLLPKHSPYIKHPMLGYDSSNATGRNSRDTTPRGRTDVLDDEHKPERSSSTLGMTPKGMAVTQATTLTAPGPGPPDSAPVYRRQSTGSRSAKDMVILNSTEHLPQVSPLPEMSAWDMLAAIQVSHGEGNQSRSPPHSPPLSPRFRLPDSRPGSGSSRTGSRFKEQLEDGEKRDSGHDGTGSLRHLKEAGRRGSRHSLENIPIEGPAMRGYDPRRHFKKRSLTSG